VRTPPDRIRQRTFFELLPKGKLLAALSLLLMLLAVLYARRHAGRALEQMQGYFLGAPPAPAPRPVPADTGRRVRLAPPPPSAPAPVEKNP
jgi:hypothetical protein